MSDDAATRPFDVSVVMPAFNEEKYLPVLLGSLRAQRTDYSIEIVVVDDHSTDRTADIAREAGAVVIPNDDKLDVVGMRNLGMQRARGRCILLTDCDCAYSPRYIQRMAKPILREGSTVDVTLALWQAPLERRWKVYPDGPLPTSYIVFLRWMPWPIGGRSSPIRPGRMLGGWLKSGLRKPPWKIGSPVRTGMLMARREVIEQIGGQRGVFGGHVDSAFCDDCLSAARECRWVGGVIHWFSMRRYWPKPGFSWLTKTIRRRLQWLWPWRKKRKRRERGYADPHGRR